MKNKDTEKEQTPLTVSEDDSISRVAEVWGISREEAATRLTSQALARRIKRNTGKTPAKVYSIKR